MPMTAGKVTLKALVSLTLVTMLVSTVNAAPPTVIWSDPVGTDDIALSKDGKYVAIAVGHEVRFYGRSSSTPIWTYVALSAVFHSVAISADGDCLAAGTAHPGGGEVYFWKNARTRTPSTADPTWITANLGGVIDRRCLDISDDGNYVVACGTGRWVFYWADAKGLSGNDKPVTWESPQFPTVECVDLSGDGSYVAAGIRDDDPVGYAVAYWKNARTLTGNDRNPNWKSHSPDEDVMDIAISDDGNYVAAATESQQSVHYWANAKSLTGDPAHTWYYGSGDTFPFNCIDMSSDGNSVIAGMGHPSDAVYFWSGAKSLTGKPQNPTWTYTTEANVHDVAIDDVGTYMAADGNTMTPSKVYFFSSGGTLLWSYPIDVADKVSISGDGATLAVGTGAGATGYLLSTGYSSGPRPVGGVVIPTNTLAILTPYVALTGLAIAVSAVVVVKKRR